MKETLPFKDILAVFAHYGFRKAAMEDLARAAGISRQTLYNRFKTKQAVLDWAVEGYLGDTRARAVAELQDRGKSPAACLLGAFARWTGDHVTLLHEAPHGAEAIELGTQSIRRSDTDPEADFERDIAAFLSDRGLATSRKQATDLAQTMIRSWGMSETLGPLSYAKGEEHIFLGREIAQHRDYSEETARKIDEEINHLIEDAYARAKQVLEENLDILHKLSDLLLEKETVMGSELDDLIHTMRPGIELPSQPLDQKPTAAEEADDTVSDTTETVSAASDDTDIPSEENNDT